MISPSMLLRIIGLCIMLIIILTILYFTIVQIFAFLQITITSKIIFLIIGLLLLLIIGSTYGSRIGIPFADEGSSIFIMIFYTLVLLAPLVGILTLIHHRTPLSPLVAAGIGLIRLGLGVYFGNVITKTPLIINNTGLEQSYKIIFISDIHVDNIRKKKYVQHVINTIKKENPDLVLIGGDLMNSANKEYVSGFAPFNQLNIPVYSILGNHDHMGDIEAPYGIFKTTPIIPLVNQSVSISGLQIVGIDDKSVWGERTLEQILAESNIQTDAKYTILLSHQPQKLSKFNNYPINLELAGHTHRGQIIPFSWLVGFFNDYAYGRYDEDGKTAFVSQGIGGWGGPLRMGTQSEMVIITLNP